MKNSPDSIGDDEKFDLEPSDTNKIKIICLGDSGVGKSKLLERFLMDDYIPIQQSTYAVNIFKYRTNFEGANYVIDFWDTAGQEIFQSLHPSYYHQAHGCIMVFDAKRKVTYKNLNMWYEELRQFRPYIPVWCAVNKIDVNDQITNQKFNFVEKNGIPMYYVAASNGINVVKLFNDAIEGSIKYSKNPEDITDQILNELQKIN